MRKHVHWSYFIDPATKLLGKPTLRCSLARAERIDPWWGQVVPKPTLLRGRCRTAGQVGVIVWISSFFPFGQFNQNKEKNNFHNYPNVLNKNNFPKKITILLNIPKKYSIWKYLPKETQFQSQSPTSTEHSTKSIDVIHWPYIARIRISIYREMCGSLYQLWATDFVL